jgi:hypothetical protein
MRDELLREYRPHTPFCSACDYALRQRLLVSCSRLRARYCGRENSSSRYHIRKLGRCPLVQPATSLVASSDRHWSCKPLTFITKKPASINTQHLGEGLKLVVENVTEVVFNLRDRSTVELNSPPSEPSRKGILSERRNTSSARLGHASANDVLPRGLLFHIERVIRALPRCVLN